MKQLMYIFLGLSMMGSFVFCGDVSTSSEEHIAIKKVIESAYVHGYFIDRDVEAVKNGFHPGFSILVLDKEGKLGTLPFARCIEIVEARSKDKKETDIRHKFPMIDVTGKAAAVKIEIYKAGKLLYTDYLSLYKFADGWKIVSKIYHRHN